MIPPLELPPADDGAWRLANAGEARYSGGWLPLDRTLDDVLRPPFRPEPLRFPQSGNLSVWPRLWVTGMPEWLSPVDRYLLRWPLFLDVRSLYNGEWKLTEQMLLVPEKIRIRLDAVSLEELEPVAD